MRESCTVYVFSNYICILRKNYGRFAGIRYRCAGDTGQPGCGKMTWIGFGTGAAAATENSVLRIRRYSCLRHVCNKIREIFGDRCDLALNILNIVLTV